MKCSLGAVVGVRTSILKSTSFKRASTASVVSGFSRHVEESTILPSRPVFFSASLIKRGQRLH